MLAKYRKKIRYFLYICVVKLIGLPSVNKNEDNENVLLEL